MPIFELPLTFETQKSGVEKTFLNFVLAGYFLDQNQFWAHKNQRKNFDKLTKNTIFNNCKYDYYKLIMINYKLTLITINTEL